MRSTRYLFIMVVCAMALISGPTVAGAVLLLHADLPDSSARFYGELKQGMTSAGYTVDEVDAASLPARLERPAGPGDVLVVPNARHFPVEAAASLPGFLKRGNHLMAVSGPMFEKAVTWSGGKWTTKDEALSSSEPLKGKVFIDFAKQDLSTWSRMIGTPGNKGTYTHAQSGRRDLPGALRVEFDPLEGWELYDSPSILGSIPKGCTAIAFYTTSESATDMGVQCMEVDGTRWIANIKIPQGTKRFVLTESDFNLWRDKVGPGRGGANDHVHLDNTRQLSFIFSQDNDKSTRRSLLISDMQAVEDGAIFTFVPPVIESISPFYKVYRTYGFEGRIDGGSAFPVNAELVSPIMRSRGFGSDAVRKWRMIPVMDVYDTKGERRGTAAHIFLNNAQDYAGSTWGYIGLSQETLDKDPGRYSSLAVSMLKRITRGVFLANAGTNQFAYVDGEKAKYAACASNLSGGPVDAEVDFSIRSSEGKVVDASTVYAKLSTEKLKEVPGRSVVLPPGEYRISTVLKVKGEEIDRIAYPFRVIRYHELTQAERVIVHNGSFRLNGKTWYGLGMNYWPLASSGFENVDLYAEHWLDPAQYDPEAVEKDLALADKLGMTLLSVQYLFPRQAPAFMDFLARAEKHGIKVNCFLDGLHPLGVNMMGAPSDWKNHSNGTKLIKAAHLDKSPAVFAYDVAWEVHLGHDTDRRQYDKAWQDWVIDRYGSIENAESDWGFTPEHVDGVISGPSDAQITSDGPWRIYVAAYRRFWDDRISEGYRAVRADVLSADPCHLVGARSGYGGTGSVGVAARFPYDLASGAKHLDFTSPEAYILSGDRKSFMQGALNAAYGRFVSGGKPVYWAEFGVPLILGVGVPDYNHGRTPENHKQQSEFIHSMMELCRETNSNGAAGWWWPGGFRISENSDFGIISPDGTPRPAALEMKRAADSFCEPRETPKPDVLITVDRDKHVTGYAGLYQEIAPRLAKSIVDGKFPGVRTAGAGTTSANTPLVAVGNTPCNGHNPPKYLNAEFNWIKVNGKQVTDDAVVEVERGKPIYVEASIGNTAEAAWIAPKHGAQGEVYLLAESESGKSFLPISHDTPFLGDASVSRSKLVRAMDKETTFVFRMVAKDRAEFGEVLRMTIRPRR